MNLTRFGTSVRYTVLGAFVLRARDRGIAVAIVNQGETRGDPHAALRLNLPLSETLPALARALSP